MVIDYSNLSSQSMSSRGKVAQPSNSAVSSKSSGESAPAPSSTGAGDTVKLSSTAQALIRSESLDSTPDVDSERVAKLKADIESGSYQVDSRRVAEGMLRYERLMG